MVDLHSVTKNNLWKFPKGQLLWGCFKMFLKQPY